MDESFTAVTEDEDVAYDIDYIGGLKYDADKFKLTASVLFTGYDVPETMFIENLGDSAGLKRFIKAAPCNHSIKMINQWNFNKKSG